MLNEIVREFLLESQTALERLDGDLLAMELGQHTAATLDQAFRAMHTIKGTCGFLGFARLGGIVHDGETCLDRMRNGETPVTAETVATLFGMVDEVRGLLTRIEQTGTDDPEAAPADDSWAAFMADDAAPAAAESPPPADLRESTLRIDVDVLDTLMNLIGELVLTRNEIQQLQGASQDPAVLKATQRLSLVTSELQASIMKARLQPISHIWNAMPRLVRDLSVACSKPVDLIEEGRDTELDKAILEAIRAPLTHLVRNAVDHGIEPAETRAAAGKPAGGRITLRARHAGGQVIIEVSDDGRGLSPETIRQKAVDKGLISAEDALRLGDREAVQLVFLPGFSTRDDVTTVSGRGVGMDVVKTNVERIGGSVELTGLPGEGTTARLRIPLTLAIMPSLAVLASGETYALPQVHLVELVYLEGSRGRRAIEFIHEAPVLRRHGKLLPLVALNQVLQLPHGRNDLADGEATLNIVVLQANGQHFGLIVDDVADSEDIVVKPLGAELRGLSVYAGATIMGNGRAALILDVPGLARAARTLGEQGDGGLAADDGPVATEAGGQEMVIFTTADGGRIAVPLNRVTRLEEFGGDRVEQVGGREMIQYRDTVMPLIRVSGMLPERRRQPRQGTEADDPAAGTLPVLVHTTATGPVGISIGPVLDVLPGDLAALQPATRDGVLGTLVIQGRITEILDIDRLLQQDAQRGRAS